VDVLSLILGLIGIIPVIYISYQYLLNYLPVRKFLAFNSVSEVDAILTTSSIDDSSKGAKVQRATTGIGQVQGVSHLSKFVGKFYKKKTINIYLGNGLTIRPNKDVVLLGGASKNEYSRRFLNILSEKNPNFNLIIDDEKSNLTFTDSDEVYDISYLDIHNGLPTKDIGIVICCKNPFSPASESGRLIYCAGFTSYGTSGSALWIFDDILTAKGGFKHLVSKVGNKSPNFIAILNLEIVNGGVAAVELINAYNI